MSRPVRFSSPWARALAALLVLLLAAPATARPRAAAVAPGSPALARAALEALDRVPGLSPLRAQVLREALIPRGDEPAPAAQAHALAAAAEEVGARDAVAAAALFDRALALALSLSPAEARAWMDRHGERALAAIRRAGRDASPLERRLRLWRGGAPSGPTAALEVTLEPAAAEVILDGRAVGTGPTVRLEGERGVHDLRVEAPGYLPHVQVIDLGTAPKLAVKLQLADPVADLRRLVAEIGRVQANAEKVAPLLAALGRRLDVAMVFLVSPDDGGALVRLYDVEDAAFAAAGPVAATDPTTLARSFRALLDLRGTATRIARKPRARKKRPFGEPLWKKWWVWAIVLGAAGAATGAVLIARQRSDSGTLTVRLRRSP
jgi:hypothetical protein